VEKMNGPYMRKDRIPLETQYEIDLTEEFESAETLKANINWVNNVVPRAKSKQILKRTKHSEMFDESLIRNKKKLLGDSSNIQIFQPLAAMKSDTRRASPNSKSTNSRSLSAMN
jgi:hypothetical protein